MLNVKFFCKLNTGIKNVFDVGASGISSYPSKTGIFRTTGLFTAGLPSGATDFGALIIYGGGYYVHIYIGSDNSAMYIGVTIDKIAAPTNWKKVTIS